MASGRGKRVKETRCHIAGKTVRGAIAWCACHPRGRIRQPEPVCQTDWREPAHPAKVGTTPHTPDRASSGLAQNCGSKMSDAAAPVYQQRWAFNRHFAQWIQVAIMQNTTGHQFPNALGTLFLHSGFGLFHGRCTGNPMLKANQPC